MPRLELFSRSSPKEVEMRSVGKVSSGQSATTSGSVWDSRQGASGKLNELSSNVNELPMRRRLMIDPSDGLPATSKGATQLTTTAVKGNEENFRPRRNSAQLFGGSLADPLLLNAYDQL